LITGSTPSPVNESHSASEKPSWKQPRTELSEIPESENQTFVLEGNPAKMLGYRVTRKTNTSFADFVLATHPDE
jgi:hypothetical protein